MRGFSLFFSFKVAVLVYRLKEKENGEKKKRLRGLIEPVLGGLGFCLVELVLAEHKGGASLRVVIYRKDGVGIEDCARAHHAIMPRLELVFGAADLHVEVSSPGTERLIKEGAELRNFGGTRVKCWVKELSGWKCGLPEEVCESGIKLRTEEGLEEYKWESIAKAKFDNINSKVGM